MTDYPLVSRARRLRQDLNGPERAAWDALRKLRPYGIAVRRQHPVGPYVVDFAITKRQLVIEIDGGVHRLESVRARDELRERKITALGWRVLRLSAEEALSRDYLVETGHRGDRPLKPLSPMGRGVWGEGERSL